MLQTVEAIVDINGRVQLLESVKIKGRRKALVTILDEEIAAATEEKSIVGSMQLLDEDLAGGSQAIAQMLKLSLEKSAETLTD